jgi:signal transduction histidine kinase
MNDFPARRSGADLQRQREQISRGLRRLNTAAIVILLIVLALAMAAIAASRKSQREQARAEAAERDARRKLYDTHLARARAERSNENMGRRQRAENAIAAAVALRASLPAVNPTELRNEAVASLALTDIEIAPSLFPLPRENAVYRFDATLGRFALAQTNGDITLHNASDGAELRRFQTASNATVLDIAFAEKDRTLLALLNAGTIVVLSLATNEPTGQLDIRGVRAIEVSPNGRWVAAITWSNEAHIFDLRRNRKEVAQFSNARALAFYPNGEIVALSVPGRILFQNFNGTEVLPPLTNIYPVAQLMFRPDGNQLAAADRHFGIKLWQVRSGERMSLRSPLGDFYGLHYDPGGEMIAAALGDGASRIWSTRTGELLHRVEGGRIASFDSSGQRIAFERPREGISTGRIVESPVLRRLRWSSSREYYRRFWGVDFSGDGRWVGAGDATGLVIWDTTTGRAITKAPSRVRQLSVAWSASRNEWITTSSTNIGLYSMNPTSGWPRLSKSIPIECHPDLGRGTLSPDGRTMGVVVAAHSALLVDLEQPERRTVLRFKGAGSMGHLAFSPDGKWVASSATREYGLLVWEAATGNLVQQIPGAHGRVAFHPSGNQLVLGTADEFSFWNTSTWQEETGRSIPRDNLAETTGAVAYSPDGKWLALARTRQLVQLVDAATGRELASLTAPQPETISWLHFNAQGDRLAAATFDGSVQLWDLGAIQDRLAAWRLEWDRPARPMTAPIGPAASRTFLLLPLCAVGLVLAFVAYAFRRQSHLFDAYLQVDQLASRRAEELQAAQTEIVHAQKMKALGTLAAGIAHDFNNLLSVIRMSNQLTGEEARENPSVRENVAEIEQAVTQGKRVVRSMLGYSREENDATAPFALADLVEDTVALLTKQFLSGITLTLELDRNLPPVNLSRNRLEQILLNLIVNASDAMKGSGHLQIVARREAGTGGVTVLRPRAAPRYAELVVGDSGPGIDPEILPRIFEPFFTTKTRDATRGTGLGLSTVYTMAEQDGLGISVKSVAGRGTEFRILLPLG